MKTYERMIIRTLIFGLGMAAGYTRNAFLFSLFAGVVLVVIMAWDEAKYRMFHPGDPTDD